MRNVKQFHSTGSGDRFPEVTAPGAWPDEAEETEDGVDHPVVVRRACPSCAQPVAVSPGETELPAHAVCSTPWNPFGSTVCDGSGRPVPAAVPVMEPAGVVDTEALSLPAGLDWRSQPFSHAVRVAPREAVPVAAPPRQVRRRVDRAA
ncbi:hypothetical protein [Streptomyces bohaiensis]|uniref:hypothetical protein n=1 Tax=Streptomyces bohaiensis TaxID=1431344 RepID=UPI001ADD8909|nr:hypothetical protein [Streptomyces bohaiensis]